MKQSPQWIQIHRRDASRRLRHIPCLVFSAHQVDDHIRVLQGPLDGVFVPGIPLLQQDRTQSTSAFNLSISHVCKFKINTIHKCLNIFLKCLHLCISYQEHDLSKISHRPQVHDVILVTAMRDQNLRAHATCKLSVRINTL